MPETLADTLRAADDRTLDAVLALSLGGYSIRLERNEGMAMDKRYYTLHAPGASPSDYGQPIVLVSNDDPESDDVGHWAWQLLSDDYARPWLEYASTADGAEAVKAALVALGFCIVVQRELKGIEAATFYVLPPGVIHCCPEPVFRAERSDGNEPRVVVEATILLLHARGMLSPDALALLGTLPSQPAA